MTPHNKRYDLMKALEVVIKSNPRDELLSPMLANVCNNYSNNVHNMLDTLNLRLANLSKRMNNYPDNDPRHIKLNNRIEKLELVKSILDDEDIY